VRRRLAGRGAHAGRRGAGVLLRGLYFAIVDEADSVLIDEARTPLIISSDVDDPQRAPSTSRRWRSLPAWRRRSTTCCAATSAASN
jgi:hypothetical protein